MTHALSPLSSRTVLSILVPYSLRGALLSFLYLILPAVLRSGGVSLAATALSLLVLFPIGLTWLWAPLMDRPSDRGRRGWVGDALLVAVAALVVLAMLDPVRGYASAMVVASLIAAAAGTIGTATDAMIVDTVAKHDRGWANALQAGGVAVGGLTVGGVGLVYATQGWSASAYVMAIIALAGYVLLRIVPAGPMPMAAMEARANRNPFSILRSGIARHTLLVVIVTRASLHLPMGILASFLVDADLSVSTIALIGGLGGSIAGLLGAFLGGLVSSRLAVRPAVMATLAAAALAAVTIAVLVGLFATTRTVAFAVSGYVFFLTTPVFVAMHRQFMTIAREGRYASDMSILTGSEFLIGLSVAASVGWIAEGFGYAAIFWVAAVSACIGVVLVQVGSKD